jgi:DNA-binding NtrC family response regulator
MELPAAGSLRLHRESLTNVLIVGGSAERRDQVARAFHQESPLRAGGFVHVDGARDEGDLRLALLAWTSDLPQPTPNPYRAAEHGTLYVDQVERLSEETQKLLLKLARQLQDPRGNPVEQPCAGRLVAGSSVSLADAITAGHLMAPLHDALDKVRVQLDEVAPGTSA